MSNIGTPFLTAIPAVGSLGTAYATSINDILTEVMARLAAKVPLSSLAIADTHLNLNNFGLVDAQYVQFYEQLSLPAGAPFGRLARYAGNLYWVDSAGAIQITSGTGLNAAGIGGIVGDYGGVNPAKVAFVDATETYEFYDDMSLNQWAVMKSRGWDLINEASGFYTQIRRASGGANHTFTFPAALPGGNTLMALDAAGNFQLSSAANVTVGWVQAADITLSGATKIRHGSRRHHVEMQGWPAGGMASVNFTKNPGFVISAAAGFVYMDVTQGWQQNWRATSVTVDFNKTTAGLLQIDLQLYRDGALVSTIASNSSNAVGIGSVSAGLGVPTTFNGNDTIYLKVTVPAANDKLLAGHIVYDVV